MGLGISRDVEDVPGDVDSSDEGQSVDEKCGSGPDEDTQYRRNYKEFNEKYLEMNRKIRFEKLLRFRDLVQFKHALKQFSIQNEFEYTYEKSDKKQVMAACKSL